MTGLWSAKTAVKTSLFINRSVMPVPTQSYSQTGQTGCYDRYGGLFACAGSGQDAKTGLGAAWQSRGRFGVHNGGVIDTASGLHWLQDAGFGEFPVTWQEALEFIQQE
jgi:hypothetical protein